MAKFIEVYKEGRTILLNADHVTAIEERNRCNSDIYMVGNDKPQRADTSLDDICTQLEQLKMLADID